MTRQTKFKPITRWMDEAKPDIAASQKAGTWRVEFADALDYRSTVSYLQLEMRTSSLTAELLTNSVCQSNLFSLNAVLKSQPWLGAYSFKLN